MIVEHGFMPRGFYSLPRSYPGWSVCGEVPTLPGCRRLAVTLSCLKRYEAQPTSVLQ
jgi:hypothetical protein